MFYFSKKFICFFIAIVGFTTMSFAQNNDNTNPAGQPFAGSKNFRKFSVGVNAGALAPSIVTGGSNDFTNSETTFGYGANLRYQFTHYFALQADFLRGNLEANQEKGSDVNAPGSRPNQSFDTDMKWAGSISGQFTFGNVNWLSVKNTIVPYISAGAGYARYEPMIVKTGTTNAVPYSADILSEFFVPVGLGLKVNLSPLMDLDLGYRMHFLDGDNLDGTPFTISKDKFSYGFAGLEFALGKQSKPRLLFDNPASRANSILQSQVSDLNTKVDSLSAVTKRLSDDTDGDGVADIFDKEPATAAGTAVDAHGVSADTDADGVPDYRDKQLITPTECQPVDADGVGKCPDPECCKTISDSTACVPGSPGINFTGNSFQLSGKARGIISTLSTQLKNNPNCNIIIKGYSEPSKSSQSVCQKRLEAIKKWMVEKEGISAERISTDCSVGGGDKNTVDIISN